MCLKHFPPFKPQTWFFYGRPKPDKHTVEMYQHKSCELPFVLLLKKCFNWKQTLSLIASKVWGYLSSETDLCKTSSLVGLQSRLQNKISWKNGDKNLTIEFIVFRILFLSKFILLNIVLDIVKWKMTWKDVHLCLAVFGQVAH